MPQDPAAPTGAPYDRTGQSPPAMPASECSDRWGSPSERSHGCHRIATPGDPRANADRPARGRDSRRGRAQTALAEVRRPARRSSGRPRAGAGSGLWRSSGAALADVRGDDADPSLEERDQARRALDEAGATQGAVPARPLRGARRASLPAEGRGRNHVALELPDRDDREPAEQRPGRRKSGDDQALRVQPGDGRSPRGALRGVLRGRRGRGRDGGPGGRCRLLEPAAESHPLHWSHDHRPQGHGSREPQPHTGHPRARRKVSRDRRSLGGHRRGRRAGHLGQVQQRGAGLPVTGLCLRSERVRRLLPLGLPRHLPRPVPCDARQPRLHGDDQRATLRPHAHVPGRGARGRCPPGEPGRRGAEGRRPSYPRPHRGRPDGRSRGDERRDLRSDPGRQALRRRGRLHRVHQRSPDPAGPLLLRQGSRRAGAGPVSHALRRCLGERSDHARGLRRPALRRRRGQRHRKLSRTRRLQDLQPRPGRVHRGKAQPPEARGMLPPYTERARKMLGSQIKK